MLHIFTDASVDPILKKGIGSYLLIHGPLPTIVNRQTQRKRVKCLKFLSGCSMQAEMGTFKHVMDLLEENEAFYLNKSITAYTDCNKIFKLSVEKSYNHEDKYADLYEDILASIEKFNINVIRLEGHPKTKKEITAKMFSIVDTCSRHKLRSHRHDESWWNS